MVKAPKRKPRAKSKKPSKKIVPLISKDEFGEMIERVEICRTVIDEIDNSKIFRIIKDDLQREAEDLDNVWHTIKESEHDRRFDARVFKTAATYVVNLKSTYQEELKDLLAKLDLYAASDKNIVKDWDNN